MSLLPFADGEVFAMGDSYSFEPYDGPDVPTGLGEDVDFYNMMFGEEYYADHNVQQWPPVDVGMPQPPVHASHKTGPKPNTTTTSATQLPQLPLTDFQPLESTSSMQAWWQPAPGPAFMASPSPPHTVSPLALMLPPAPSLPAPPPPSPPHTVSPSALMLPPAAPSALMLPSAPSLPAPPPPSPPHTVSPPALMLPAATPLPLPPPRPPRADETPLRKTLRRARTRPSSAMTSFSASPYLAPSTPGTTPASPPAAQADRPIAGRKPLATTMASAAATAVQPAALPVAVPRTATTAAVSAARPVAERRPGSHAIPAQSFPPPALSGQCSPVVHEGYLPAPPSVYTSTPLPPLTPEVAARVEAALVHHHRFARALAPGLFERLQVLKRARPESEAEPSAKRAATDEVWQTRSSSLGSQEPSTSNTVGRHVQLHNTNKPSHNSHEVRDASPDTSISGACEVKEREIGTGPIPVTGPAQQSARVTSQPLAHPRAGRSSAVAGPSTSTPEAEAKPAKVEGNAQDKAPARKRKKKSEPAPVDAKYIKERNEVFRKESGIKKYSWLS